MLPFIYWSFIESFQLYHGDRTLIHYTFVNKQVLVREMFLAKGHSTKTAATGDRTRNARLQNPQRHLIDHGSFAM